jgi:hypothetical protein
LSQRAVHVIEGLVFHSLSLMGSNMPCILWFHHATVKFHDETT